MNKKMAINLKTDQQIENHFIQPKEFSYNLENLEEKFKSITKLVSRYFWCYLVSVLFFIFAAITYVIPTNSMFSESDKLTSITALIIVGGVFTLICFVLSAFLAIKTGAINNTLISFNTLFVLFLIGMFLNIFSIIATFIILREKEKLQLNNQLIKE